jgi:hypothetical protein
MEDKEDVKEDTSKIITKKKKNNNKRNKKPVKKTAVSHEHKEEVKATT